MFVFVFKSWHCSRYLLMPRDVTWNYPRGITWMIGTTLENHNITKINWGVFIYWLASIITHIIFIFPVVKDWSDMKLIQMITWINKNKTLFIDLKKNRLFTDSRIWNIKIYTLCTFFLSTKENCCKMTI